MKTTLATILSTMLLVGALAGPALAAARETTVPAEPPRGPVYVDGTDLLYLESFPVQVMLHVSGSLPTPCDETAWEVQVTDQGIEVTLWSVRDPGSICATVLAPFEVSIALGSYESANLPVTLNGEPAGRVQLPGPSGSPDAAVPEPRSADALLGGGWSFGMCIGLCSAKLATDGDSVVVTGHDRSQDGTFFRNAGTWTPEARARIAAALAALEGVALQDVYGCPDCADGGASTLLLLRDGVESTHSMEFGAPPAELAELEDVVRSAIEALRDCRSGDVIEVSEGCVAWDSEG